MVGDPIDSFINHDFRVNREPIRPFRRTGVFAFMTNLLVPKPHIEPKKCVRCGVCVETCPADPKAVDWGPEGRSGHPEYDYSNCIRCYCCQEMCPESAIYLKDPPIGRIFRGKNR
jgi:MinD superfamily P-loop ATPase